MKILAGALQSTSVSQSTKVISQAHVDFQGWQIEVDYYFSD